MVVLTKIAQDGIKVAAGASIAFGTMFVKSKISNKATWKPWRGEFYSNKPADKES